MHRFTGILGMITMMGLAYAFSTNRRAIRYKTVAWGLGLQIAFAFLVMRSDYGRLAFEKLGAGANWLLDFAYYGTSFVFGDLGEKNSPRGFYFAFQALPTIIFIAALFAVLYYLGIMQIVIRAAAWVMQWWKAMLQAASQWPHASSHSFIIAACRGSCPAGSSLLAGA